MVLASSMVPSSGGCNLLGFASVPFLVAAVLDIPGSLAAAQLLCLGFSSVILLQQ